MTYIKATIELQDGIPYVAPVWCVDLGGIPLFVVLNTKYWLGLN